MVGGSGLVGAVWGLRLRVRWSLGWRKAGLAEDYGGFLVGLVWFW